MTTSNLTGNELGELINAAINEGARLAAEALGLDHAAVDNLFLRNVKFSQKRNQKRTELLEKAQKKGRAK